MQPGSLVHGAEDGCSRLLDCLRGSATLEICFLAGNEVYGFDIDWHILRHDTRHGMILDVA